MRENLLIAGKYRVLKELGAGGMGSVWLARNENTEREFALKVLNATAAAQPRALERFFQEAKVSGRLRHPSLLEIYDVGIAEELGGVPYLVMELLDGAALDAALRQLGKLPVPMAVEVLATVARALALVHDKGIIHRDLKPANIFLHRPGTGAVVPKLLDFGISKFVATPGKDTTLGLTQTGSLLGSPIYMSPEQMDPEKVIDARSDVHALGVVLWECLTGDRPFKASGYNTLIVEVMTAARPKLKAVMPGASDALEAIVGRAFAVDRDARFPTALALADALDAELATMGAATTLTARTSAAELFTKLALPSVRAPPLQISTTGGLSMAGADSAASPAAYTVQGPSSVSGLASTEAAPPPFAMNTSPRANAITAVPTRLSAPSSRKKLPLIAGAVAASAALALVVAFAVSRNSAQKPAESGVTADRPALTSTPMPTPIPTVTAIASPVASASSTPSASAPSASASAPAIRTPKEPPASSAPALATAHPTQKPPKPPASAGASNRGVTSSGL